MFFGLLLFALTGDSEWYKGYPDCALDEQSPINIAADVETVVKVSRFVLAETAATHAIFDKSALSRADSSVLRLPSPILGNLPQTSRAGKPPPTSLKPGVVSAGVRIHMHRRYFCNDSDSVKCAYMGTKRAEIQFFWLVFYRVDLA